MKTYNNLQDYLGTSPPVCEKDRKALYSGEKKQKTKLKYAKTLRYFKLFSFLYKISRTCNGINAQINKIFSV